MTIVTTEFGRKTSLKAIPSKKPPMNLERFLREHGEEELGRMMREADGSNGAVPEMPDNSDMLERDSYRSIAGLLRVRGEATSREIRDALDMGRETANTRLNRLRDAGFVTAYRDVTMEGWPLVWSLVECEG